MYRQILKNSIKINLKDLRTSEQLLFKSLGDRTSKEQIVKA